MYEYEFLFLSFGPIRDHGAGGVAAGPVATGAALQGTAPRLLVDSFRAPGEHPPESVPPLQRGPAAPGYITWGTCRSGSGGRKNRKFEAGVFGRTPVSNLF